MDSVTSVRDGIVVPKIEAEEWEKMRATSLRPDDVLVCTFPRSGTTWMQYIVKLLQNGGVDDGISLDDAVPWLDVLESEVGKKMNPNFKSAEDLPSPRTFKSHLPYHLMPGGLPHTQSAKYIYIARNPKDVCVSFWYFTKSQVQKFTTTEDLSLIPWEGFCSDFCEGRAIAGLYGGWSNHVLEWWKHRNEPNILFIMYENIQKEPYENVRTIAEFIGIKDNVQEIVDTVVSKMSFSKMLENPSVNKRKKEGADSVEMVYLRKGIIGDWRNHFTSEQDEEYEGKIAKTMKEHGLEFQYE